MWKTGTGDGRQAIISKYVTLLIGIKKWGNSGCGNGTRNILTIGELGEWLNVNVYDSIYTEILETECRNAGKCLWFRKLEQNLVHKWEVGLW